MPMHVNCTCNINRFFSNSIFVSTFSKKNLFCFIFILLFLFMMRDLRRDIATYCSHDYRTSDQSPIVASWVDLGTISLSVLTLLGGSELLWLVLTVLLLFYVLVELIQMYSLTWKYFIEISNWIDL